MGSISGMRLRVKTEELEKTADEVEGQVAVMQRKFDEVQRIVEQSSNYWEGKGQNAYLNNYRSKMEAVQEALNCFSENVDDLRIIAGIYEKGEKSAVETAENLETDIIV